MSRAVIKQQGTCRRERSRLLCLLTILAALFVGPVLINSASAVLPPLPLYSKAPVQKNSYPNPNKRITLNFTNIKTRKLLQIIAQFTGLNFVISDKVTSRMSIHLEHIPWQEALTVILKSQGLGKRRVGHSMIIAPLGVIAKLDMQELQIKQQQQASVTLRNRIVRLKYAKAEDIHKLLTQGGPLLSKRGQISVDERTNSIWIRDTPEQLNTVVRLIKKLDYPVKQVLIEARIVRINRPYERQLGARFGISSPRHLSGTLEGATQLAQGIQPANVVPIAERLNFDVPVASLFGPAGTIGLAVARIGGSTVLDLELSALEHEGHVQLISSPRLITSSQHPAYIQTGEEIPYEESTSSGATSIAFKNAVLSLKVTPQITPDNRIILDLTVTNDQPGTTVPTGTGKAIAIRTEEEQSRVLVNDHQTVVLGGVYTQDKRKIITRIPFLGRIPLLGRLFTHEEIQDNKSELLIFLTPHIIHKPSELE